MRHVILFFLITISNNLVSQPILELGKFPTFKNDGTPIKTEKLLNSIGWEEIKAYSNFNEGHYAYEKTDSLRNYYDYTQQGRVATFQIMSFNGNVLEFKSEISNTNQPSKVYYFDKKVWMSYINTAMPNIPEKFKLNIENHSVEILKAYYTLIGLNARQEYGWICEYSGLGMPPQQRTAILELLLEKELLLKLLEYPNIYSQLYAADALIYENYNILKELENSKDQDEIAYLKSELLTDKIWDKIFAIRDKNKKIYTCGNIGSYKTYKSNTSLVLSKEAIEEIPKKYDVFYKIGYIR